LFAPPQKHSSSYSSQNKDNYHIVHSHASSQQTPSIFKPPPQYQHHSFPHQEISYPKKHNFLDFDEEFHNKFRPPSPFNLFTPSNNSVPELDIVKLTRETIQSDFRPVRPLSRPQMYDYDPNHSYPPSPQEAFYKNEFQNSFTPPPSPQTIPHYHSNDNFPTTTPEPIYLASATASPTPFAATSKKPSFSSLFTDQPSRESYSSPHYSTHMPTATPLFEPSSTVLKRKRKKTTTTPSPHMLFEPTPSDYQYPYSNTSSFSISQTQTEPEPYTAPTALTWPPHIYKNDHRFYIPPSTTTEELTTTETITKSPTTSRRKPIRYRIPITTRNPTTPAPLSSLSPISENKKPISEEYYDNFKLSPTQSTTTKRPRKKPRPTVSDSKTTTTTTRTTATKLFTTRSPMKSSTRWVLLAARYVPMW